MKIKMKSKPILKTIISVFVCLTLVFGSVPVMSSVESVPRSDKSDTTFLEYVRASYVSAASGEFPKDNQKLFIR
jgi:hypothetical protein